MDSAADPKTRQWVSAFAAAVISILLGLILFQWWRRIRARQARSADVWHDVWQDVSQLQGLTEEEAEARQELLPRARPEFGSSEASREIWRRNVLSIFNLNLIGLSVALLLLGQPLDALTSAAGAAFGIVMNVRQQILAGRALQKVAADTLPEATVIREGNVRTIDPRLIVRGDVLLVGPGDPIFADGQVVGNGRIMVDESALTGKSDRYERNSGDDVHAGSFCVQGRAAVEATRTRGNQLAAAVNREDDASAADMTPLQTIIERILRVLLAVVIVTVIALLAAYAFAEDDSGLEFYKDAISMAFGIAPTGLFFMFLITYAVATADIVKLGAVIHRPQAVEGLANVTVICFGKSSGLTGVDTELDAIDLSEVDDGMTQRRIRSVLGDFAHSSSVSGPVSRALAAEFTGERRQSVDEAPYFSAYGWNALAFDETDLRGVFVLGDPDILAPNLVVDLEDAGFSTDEEDAEEPEGVKALVGRLAGVFRRGDHKDDATEEAELSPNASAPEPVGAKTSDGEGAGALASASTTARSMLGAARSAFGRDDGGDSPGIPSDVFDNSDETAPQPAKPSRFRNMLQRVTATFVRRDDASDEQKDEDEEDQRSKELIRLLFAYVPRVVALRDRGGAPQLPTDLVPLCHLRLVEQVREEAVAAIQTFSDEGVGVKIVASDSVRDAVRTASQVGLGDGDGADLQAVSGNDLKEMDSDQFTEAVTQNAVFGDLTPDQTGRIVQVLMENGEHVAMVGSGFQHVAALRRANIKITIQNASQAALGTADIVLLNDSLATLSDVLKSGQRIVNNILDMLKLNLTQVFYLAMFLAATAFMGFPYAPKHGSFISLFTLSLPITGLSLWAATGALPSRVMASRLRHFILPAGATMVVTALAVHFGFRATTGGDIEYAQLATAYTVVMCGLVLVVFVQPPTKAWVGGDVFSGDRRPTQLATLLLIGFLLISPISLAQRFLNTAPLRQLSDYALIALAVTIWAVVLRTLWRSRLLRRGLEMEATPVPEPE